MAAGIVSLALEANRQLTWRDMQHLVLRTADPTALLGNQVRPIRRPDRSDSFYSF